MRASRAVLIAVFAVLLGAIAPEPGFAQDVTPKVLPDRIDDVPDAPGSPFPRFDNFSWRAFIALNWPALTDLPNRGKPDRAKKFGDPGPRVWETYKARYEVFAPGAPEPAVWESYKGANPCGGAVGNENKTLSAFSHFADYNQAAFSLTNLANPLVDQNRAYTRYEVRFNREQFDTIKNNEWYIKSKLPTETKPGTFKDGSIEVKAAWRILKAGDNTKRERFYVTKAFVFDPDATKKTGSTVCNEQEVALIGFHIVIKTKLRPQWIWSSFEHIDNVPPKSDEPDAKTVPAPYSYNSGMPPMQLVPTLSPRAISAANPPSPSPDPMQVVRLQAIQPETMSLNRAYWALPEVKGTVWENYMLIMTQWPRIPGTPSVTNSGAPFPLGVASTLANTTMETYRQKNGSSCMECHQEVANSTGKDFVAFMSFDAVEPAHNAIAAVASSGQINTSPLGKMVPMTASKKSKAVATKDRKTALDDDPAVRALVRMLQAK